MDSEPPIAWYSYAVVQVVPRVERGERVNVGVILLCRERGFLGAQFVLDEPRLRALDASLDVPTLRGHVAALEAVVAGSEEGGPVAALPPAERFHWLTAPRSTVLQTSPVHEGFGPDPVTALDELVRELVL
ncbi:MAG: DUF3037 domain-containing protein [Chloroflexota bacterium]